MQEEKDKKEEGKDFDRWNEMKKGLEKGIRPPYFYEREIWLCSIGLNVGQEQDSRNPTFSRPIVIFKKFNKLIFWGIPVTSKMSVDRYSVIFEMEGFRNKAIISQLRLFDYRRLIRKIGSLTEKDFITIEDKFIDLIKTKPPMHGWNLGGRSRL